MVLNVAGCRLGVRIIPSGVLIHLTVHHHRVVAGDPFPGTGGVGIAGLEVFRLNRLRGEVLIAFHDLTIIAFGYDGAIPDCFGHENHQVRLL